MDSELQSLFHELADLSPTGRGRYFQQHQVNPLLRQEVESLLRFDSDNTSAITEVIEATQDQLANSNHERLVGPYEIIGLLGQGGMGSVYLAKRTDGEVELRVAIKFVRGFHDRFLQERQILASLKHPGIARLLDAGRTALGQPYLVMEYVEGVPIDVYCRNLSLRAKLELFLQVCDAVAYSHRNLIVHCDLKPANILIEADGKPKLLDFGIAKILDDTAGAPATRERLLTPEYASPEQLLGMAKTTATDIYSLGVVLYKLLTGEFPQIPPARLDSSLPSDLNFVLAKALRQEPMERYLSVDLLAQDILAVLEERPVQARSGDAWYRTRKFARRHWLPLSAVAAAILSLAIGLYIANSERLVAEHRFAQLRQISNRILTFDDQIRALPGSTKARQEIVSVSTEYLDGLSREVRNDPGLKLEVANGYMLTAQVQGVPISPNLGQFKEAKNSLAKAVAQVDSVLAGAPQRADALLLAAEIEQDSMVIANSEHDWPQTLAHAARSANDLEVLSRSHPSRGQAQNASRIFMNIGQGYMNLHQYGDAARYIRRGVDLARSSSATLSTVAQGLSALANALRQSGDLQGALQSITEARSSGEHADFGSETLRALGLYAILWRQGLILGEDEGISLNRPEDALEPFQKAFDLVDLFASKDPNDATFRDRTGTAGQQLADILRHRDPARALAIYDRTLQRLREVKDNVSAHRQEAKVLAHSSYPLRALHRTEEAGRRIDMAFALLQASDTQPSLGGEWDDSMRALADQQADTGHAALARQTLLDLYSKLMAAKPTPETDLRNAFAMSRLYISLTRICNLAGQPAEAAKFDALQHDLSRIWGRPLAQ